MATNFMKSKDIEDINISDMLASHDSFIRKIERRQKDLRELEEQFNEWKRKAIELRKLEKQEN